MGAAGGILAFGNIIPEVLVQLYDAVQEGELTRAAHLQMIVSKLHGEISGYGIPGIKAILTHRGFATGQPRSPLLPLSPEQRTHAIHAWEAAMAAAGMI
jgi:dihydrodipicolinate synthase/N-acetylneuraminate lyase